ncbi:MAG: hypothetical protein SFX18_01465 [Pirellulales bacterium]|nr:hypothetical protein [Pirellulales bacterium]
MNNIPAVPTGVLCAVLVLMLGESAKGAVDVVRTYDENLVQTNRVDVSATSLTFSQMQASAAAAFDQGRGGVIDFDNGTFTNARTIDARFQGGGKSLRLTNARRDWQIGFLGSSSSSGAISGARVIFNGAPDPFPTPYFNDIVFGEVLDLVSNKILPERVTTFGMTVIDANFNGAGNNLSFNVHFSNNSSVVRNFTIPAAFNTNDTFFGWSAPAGHYITHIQFSATNNTASDDWAFITTPVPEPTLLPALVIATILGLGGMFKKFVV